MFLDFLKKNMLKIGLTVALILGILFGWAYLTFQVKEISIERTENTINVRVGSLLQIMEYVKKANIIFLKTDSLENHFVKTFKELKSVSITKNYPDRLQVTVVPLEIVAKWEYFYEMPKKIKRGKMGSNKGSESIKSENTKNNTEEKNKIVKKIGYLNKNNLFLEHNNTQEAQENAEAEAAEEEKKEEILTIVDKQPRTKEIQFYEIVKDGRYIPDIISAKAKLETVISRKITEVDYYRDAQEVYFIDDKGVAYWVYLEEDLLGQIQKLEYMLQEKNILKWRLSYIDLRINEKVIYKFDK